MFELSYFWQFRNAADDGWVDATTDNLATEFPAAESTLWEVNRDAEPTMSAFMFNFITGPGPTKFRCRVRDTDPDGNYDQSITSTTVTYV